MYNPNRISIAIIATSVPDYINICPILYMEVNHSPIFTYQIKSVLAILGECMVLRGEPNEPSIQHQGYIFMQCVDS